ncbi:hypothetical protein K4F52_008401 [Lecanicillium sp. MT-2017a]|nr:hypothetical protein K4F52_008401 [Lecanicillium sp. MT-2017a]
MEKDLLDETSPTPGKIPLPPVLGAQLDIVLIHDIQKRLRKDVLDQLQRIIQKNKHCNWLAIYLVIFLLLHNASLIIEHDADYARKHGINRRFARENMVKEYHLECSEVDLKELAELTDDDMSFLRYTQQYAKFKEWKSLRQSDFYDNTYFYICQLFEQDWHPRDMV